MRGEQAARTGRARPSTARGAGFLWPKRLLSIQISSPRRSSADARAAVNVWRDNLDTVLQAALARKRAYENAGRALQLNPDLSLPYAMLAILQVVDERYEEAIASAKRAVALGPGDVEGAHVATWLRLPGRRPICRSRCRKRPSADARPEPHARRPGSGGARQLIHRRQ